MGRTPQGPVALQYAAVACGGKMTNEWLNSAEVLRLIKKRRPEWSELGPEEEHILPFLKMGVIKAKARHAQLRTLRSYRREDNWEIPMHFWNFIENKSNFLAGFKIELRNIKNASIYIESNFPEKFLIKENIIEATLLLPSFEKSGLDDYIGHFLKYDAPITVETAKGGRKPSVQGWSRFASALAVWVHKRDDEARGIANVGVDELLAQLDQIAANELPTNIAGDLPRATYQDGAIAVLTAFKHLAGN